MKTRSLRVMPRPTKRVVVPAPAMRLVLPVLSWRSTFTASVEARRESLFRVPHFALELYSELPEGWKPSRKFRAYLSGSDVRTEHEATAVGTLDGDKRGWIAYLFYTPGELAQSLAMLATGRHALIYLGLEKPRYRQALIYSYHLEVASDPAALTPTTDFLA